VDGVAYYNCTCPEGFSGKCAPRYLTGGAPIYGIWCGADGEKRALPECGLLLGPAASS